MKVLIYLHTTMFLDSAYTALNDVHEKTPIEKLYVIGGTEHFREQVHMYGGATGIPTETLTPNWTKFGFSALNKVVRSVLDGVGLVILPNIDANSLDLSHIARDAGVTVKSLPVYGM